MTLSDANGYVIDAGVGIAFFVNGPLSAQAIALMLRLTARQPIQLHVPDLFYVECANAFWKYVRWQDLPFQEAQGNLDLLTKLELNRVSNASLVTETIELAVEYQISAYDASYLALAHRLKLPFITADEKLIRKLSNLVETVWWLGTL